MHTQLSVARNRDSAAAALAMTSHSSLTRICNRAAQCKQSSSLAALQSQPCTDRGKVPLVPILQLALKQWPRSLQLSSYDAIEISASHAKHIT